MNEAAHARIQAAILDQFARGTDPRTQDELRTHLMECSQCERLYERCAQAERALEGRSQAALTAGSLQRIEARLWQAPAPPRRWGPVLGLGAAGAIAALVLTGMVVTAPPSTPGDDLQPRGGATSPEVTGLVFRALRLRTVQGRVTVVDLATKDATVRPGDQIAFLYVNHARAEHASVVMLGPDERLRTLVPTVALDHEVEDKALGEPVPVPESVSGRIRLEARFLGPQGEQWIRSVQVHVETPE